MMPGQFVLSAAGHDKDRIYIILICDDEYAFIVDGKLRKVDKPKRKKLKHLRELDISGIEPINVNSITNRQAWNAVKAASESYHKSN